MATESPTGIIPEELMNKDSKALVINWLEAQGLPASRKRDLLFGWGQTVGVKITGAEATRVEASGL